MPQPALRPRPGGGFNQGIGAFNEYMDEESEATAVQQKALTQQTTSSAQPTTGGSALGTPQQPPAGAQAAQPPKPREVGTIGEELVTRPVQDIKTELTAFFDINKILGINPDSDDPQTKARKQQISQRWQKLEAEDQAVARQIFEKEMKQKEQEQKEQQLRKQQEAEREQQTLVMPSSPSKGPIGPGGQKKPAAVQKLEQDRKSLGGPQSAG